MNRVDKTGRRGVLLASLMVAVGGCHLIYPYLDPAGDGGAGLIDQEINQDAPPPSDARRALATSCEQIWGGQKWKATLVAGSGKPGSVDDDDADKATFKLPMGLCRVKSKLYIADHGNQVIRRVEGQIVSTLKDRGGVTIEVPELASVTCLGTSSLALGDPTRHAVMSVAVNPMTARWLGARWFGTGNPGSQDSPSRSSFRSPLALAVEANDFASSTRETMYLADTGNHLIRRLKPKPLGEWEVSTVAGSRGKPPGDQNGGALTARFNGPADVAWDGKNRRLVIADRGNHRIRAYSPESDEVTTLAGSGVAGCRDDVTGKARFNWPSAVDVDKDGVVFVADTGSNALRRIKGGRVYTVVGSGLPGNPSKNKRDNKLRGPAGVLVIDTKHVYVSDSENHRIWKFSE